MSSYSEYGSLRAVILGIGENYVNSFWTWKNPGEEISHNLVTQAIKLVDNLIPTVIREEVIQDLSDFEKILSELQIRVIRPPNFNELPLLETADFVAYGRDFYNMRDLHILFGHYLLSASPAQPNRILEVTHLKKFFSDLGAKFNLESIAAPTPKLKSDPTSTFFRDSSGLLMSFEQERLKSNGLEEEIWHRLDEGEVLFDAANIVRFNGAAVYLVSSTGNNQALDWLTANIPNFTFESTDVYRSSHLDSTILPLDEETFLVNSARVSSDNLPKSLMNKRILYFQDVARIPEVELNFHAEIRKPMARQLLSMGFQSNLAEISSPWAGMNVLSVDNKTVLVESRQEKLIRFLEKNGFGVIPVRFRHPYTMLGGLHCTTLDISRE